MSPVSVLVNGVAVDTVSARDRGFQYGDGLFETIAVSRGTPLLWERHAQRLLAGAVRLDMPPPETALLRAETDRLCRGVERGVLKIIFTRGISGRGYRPDASTSTTRALSLSPWPDYPPSWSGEGVVVRLCQTRLASQPRLAGLKHLNRLEQVLARAEWDDEYAEGLMQDESGNIVEGTMTNIFLVEGGYAAYAGYDTLRGGGRHAWRGAGAGRAPGDYLPRRAGDGDTTRTGRRIIFDQQPDRPVAGAAHRKPELHDWPDNAKNTASDP